MAGESFGRPYTDPLLERPGALRRLVVKLHADGLFVFTRRCRAKTGVFTVGKKDGSLRLVYDRRP
eukprot:14281036-Heterocapsa_arctica.AAC.1